MGNKNHIRKTEGKAVKRSGKASPDATLAEKDSTAVSGNHAGDSGDRGDNIILIGMPTSGKSTVGIILAKALGYDFLDGDILIQTKAGKKLSAIMKERGIGGFLALEQEVHCGIECSRTVIAPGGSVIYGDRAMQHLRHLGKIVYINITLDMLEERLQDRDVVNRGVALRQGQTIEDLYQERLPLYERYADITVSENGHSLEDLVLQIMKGLGRF